MTSPYSSRTKFTSTTTGTADYTPTAVSNFNLPADNANVYYYASDASGWEHGWGTYSAAGAGTLFRTTIIASSNAGAKVSWSAGTRTIIVAASAEALSAQLRGRNLLVNPAGAINQRGLSTVSDGAYFLDAWYALTQTGAVTPSQLTDPESGFPTGGRLLQAQATAQRFGFAQVIEGKNCRHLRGKNGCLTPRLRASVAMTVRYAILGWTGTEDTVTRDVIADWTSASFTAGGFFASSNLSVLGTGSAALVVSPWTTLPPLIAPLGTSFNNLIVMVWTDAAQAQNVTLDWDFVQFEEEVPSPFAFRDISEEWRRCRRLCWAQGPAAVGVRFGMGQALGSTSAQVVIRWPVRMRKTPSLSLSAAGDFDVTDAGGGTVAVTALILAVADQDSGVFNVTVASGLTAGNATQLVSDSGGVAKMIVSADL
jgi:hypothetical protein